MERIQHFAISLKSVLGGWSPLYIYDIYLLLAQVTLQKWHNEVFQHSKKFQTYRSSAEAVMAVKAG